jgi:hypothetical protein
MTYFCNIIDAGYVQATVAWQPWRGNPGVTTKVKYQG